MLYKLVSFDFDGTILDIDSSSWFLITSTLGCLNEDLYNKELFEKGIIDYKEWSRRTIELYKRYKLTKEKFLEIFSSQKLVDSCVETLNKLKEKGLKTCIISGGIKNVYDFFAERCGLEVDFPRFCTELYFDRDGNLIGGTYSNYDFEGKIKALEEVCDELGIDLDEVIFVGDGENDIPIFRVVGLSIAFRPKSERVVEEVDEVINDFSELIKVVERA